MDKKIKIRTEWFQHTTSDISHSVREDKIKSERPDSDIPDLLYTRCGSILSKKFWKRKFYAEGKCRACLATKTEGNILFI